MDFSNESFEVIVDKGTLDALMSDQREEVFIYIYCLVILKLFFIKNRY
jgi:hypothetical protein